MTWQRRIIPWEQCDTERRARLRTVWTAGELRYKLDPSQRGVYDAIRRSHAAAPTAAARTFMLDIGRRYGKTTIMLALALWAAIRHPGKRVPYGAATKEMVEEIINPNVEQLLADCPPDLRPTWRPSLYAWVFPSGARIRMVGCDLRVDDLRGPGTVAWFLDEAAFIRRLGYVLDSILMPMMLTESEAFGVLGSTPPESPGTVWSTRLRPEHQESGCYAHRTIDDNPRITPEQRAAFVAKAGGRTSTRCRREYYAEHVVEESLAIVPEYADAMASVVREVARPSHYDAYVAMDPGHIDLWAVLFGYHDFLEQLLVIEDEIVVSRKPTSVLAAMIRDKERALWGAQAPCLRVSDTAAQTICDLQNDHGITFVTTAKDDKRAALARLRRRIQEQRIVIHPRCVHLRAHLECGVWRPSGVDYAHSDEHGHFDAIDALLYLDRNIDTTHNPFPRLAAGVTAATHYIPPDAPREGQDIAELFGRRRRHG